MATIDQVEELEPSVRRRLLSRRRVEQIVSVASPLALLLLWEVAALAGHVDTRFFPAPSAIFAEAGVMLKSGELWQHLSVSLHRIVIGFVLGAVPGIVIGLATGLFS